MRSILLAGVAALVSTGAFAQTATGTGTSSSTATSQSGAVAIGAGSSVVRNANRNVNNVTGTNRNNNRSGASAAINITNNNPYGDPSSAGDPASRIGTTRTKVSGTQRLIAAPSVYSPGLTAAGLETCLGSMSVGASFPGGGFSAGSTTVDKGCDARLDARTLWSFGLKAEAIRRLCAKPEIAEAIPACQPPQTVARQAPSVSVVPTFQQYGAVASDPVISNSERPKCMHYELLRGCLD